MRQGRAGHPRRVRAGRIAHVADRRQRRRVGAGHARHRRRARARPRARHHRATSCGRPTRRPRRRARSTAGRRARRLHAGRGRADHRRRRRRGSSGSRASSPSAARRSRSSAARRWRTPTACSHALAVNALERARSAASSSRRHVLHAAVAGRRASAGAAAGARAFARGVARRSAAPQVLLLDGANPVFTAPPAWQVREALEKVPFIVSFGSFLDETSVAGGSDPAGSLVPRVVGRRRAGVGLAAWRWRAWRRRRCGRCTRRARRPTCCSTSARRLQRAARRCRGRRSTRCWRRRSRRCRRRRRRRRVDRRAGAGRLVGHAAGAGAAPRSRRATGRSRRRRRSPSRSSTATPRQYPFHFLPYPSPQFDDGSLAHLPWLQEMPDPLTSAMWSSWVEINPQTGGAPAASRRATSSRSPRRRGRCARRPSSRPGIAPDIVAMPVGPGARDVHALRERARRRTRSRFSRRVTEPTPARWPGRRRACKIARVGDRTAS